MIKTGAPKRLWDHCIELEGLIRSHTANDIDATGREVPETIMKGEGLLTSVRFASLRGMTG
jgi:hypothetical protein